MARTGDFAELEFIRARLNVLGARREHGRLSADESREYRELALRELALLAAGPLANARRGRRRRRASRRPSSAA